VSTPFIGLVGILALFALLLLRLPVWAALAMVGFIGNVVVSNWTSAIATLGQTPFDTASLYTLSVVPLFILTGGVAAASGLSADLFKAARVMPSGLRGGLAVATISASACFGAVCGSSIATAATMTPISLREMRKARLRGHAANRRDCRRRHARHPFSAIHHPGDSMAPSRNNQCRNCLPRASYPDCS
jgi:C4-dicarboxylate transporter DctM subunit